jgi:hypothetical protein
MTLNLHTKEQFLASGFFLVRHLCNFSNPKLLWNYHICIMENRENARIQGSANSLFRGVVSLWIVGACMAGEAVLALSLGLLPVTIAIPLGVLGMIWVLPALGAAFFGVLGTPYSWPLLLVDATEAGQRTAMDLFWFRGPIGTILGSLFTVYKTIFFLPFECPKFLEWLPAWIKWLLFRQPEKLYPPKPEHLDKAKVKNEYWIFVNGVATTSQIAFNDVDKLYDLFSRPIWLCHNPTDGILVDLLECVADKLGFFSEYWEPRPRRSVMGALKEALKQAEEGKYTRVVLIAHSQGTIIASNALNRLNGNAQTKQRMKKYLEVYAFANCSNQMPGDNLCKFENLSNKRDTVAWLGVLFPFPSFWEDKFGRGIDIGGEPVTEPLYWGHLLIAHYLVHLRRGKYSHSRLHDFRNGGVPSNALTPTLFR